MVIVLVIAMTPRVGWILIRYTGERASELAYPDEQAYLQVAHSLAVGQGLVDEFGYRATYMPAYPAFLRLFLVLPNPLLWARLGQAVLGACVAPATFLLTWRWLQVSRSGVAHREILATATLAGLAAAVDPFLIFFSGLLLTETLFAAVLVAAWAFIMPLCRVNPASVVLPALLAGVLLLLGLMLRPAAVVIVVGAMVAVPACRRFDRNGLLAGGIIAIMIVAGLLPWAARNRQVVGTWRWLTTRGGISLYDGLRPGATGASDLAHTKTVPGVEAWGERQWDAHWRAEAFEAARDDPVRVARLAVAKFLRTWSLTPNVRSYRQGAAAIVSAVWMSLVLALAAVGWWHHRKAVGAWVVLLLPVILVTLTHMVFVGSVRYRVPVMPMLMVLSACGAVVIWRRIIVSRTCGRAAEAEH